MNLKAEIKYPLVDLITEIISDNNMWESYNYVVRHLENPRQRRHYRPDPLPLTREFFSSETAWNEYCNKQTEADKVRFAIILQLKHEIGTGKFRINKDHVKNLVVKDGPKVREVQAPTVYKRIGCHAIMSIIEKYCYPTLINNTGASIKGRGMHWLHHIIEHDILTAPQLTTYYYQNDISKYYDSIDQEKMKECIRTYISDPVLLPILDNFITLMPKGLSKGLRSSQCFANLYLSSIHHKMLKHVERYNECGSTRYLYYNYCDDTVFFSSNKKRLWQLRDIYVAELGRLGLSVKDNEAVRPLSVGLDMLGYIHYPTHSLLRKRIKQNAARRLANVKSRKRRQIIIGSFKGMACHADCKNLFYKLTHQKMKKFSEIGVAYTPADGKKRFPGKVMRLSAIQNKEIEVHDYESDLTTSQGDGRYLVSFREIRTGEWGKFFTSSEEMKNILDQISDIEEGFPFETVIQSEIFDGNKVKYKFT